MKFTVTKENLNSSLRRIVNAVADKMTLPILNNILVEADGDVLSMTASNLEISIKTTMPALVFEAGSTTLPAKKFSQIVNDLPAGDITIETDAGEQATIACQRSFFKIHGMSAVDYPHPEDVQEEWSFSMPAQDLLKNIAKVSYARSEDETRRILNGVLFSVRGGTLTIAATDGRRLALVEKPMDSEIQADGDIILPTKVTAELAHSIDPSVEAKIKISSSHVVFESPETTITSKLVEGVYPNYRQVIPSEFANQITIPRVPFIDALRRVALVLGPNNPSVKLTLFDNTMKISAVSQEVGEASEPVDVEYQGEEMVISFNPQYFIEPLKLLDADQLIMKFSDDLSPVQLSGDEGFLYILMPMRN